MECTRLLVLYSRMSGYFMGCLNKLANDFSVRILLVTSKPSSDAPFVFSKSDNIEHFYFEDIDNIGARVSIYDPHVIYIAGWRNKDYVGICEKFRRKNVPVILGLDNPWKGNIRQQLLTLFAGRFIHKKFSHIWVPGYSQFTYAVKLGFPRSRILKGLYCAEDIYRQKRANVHSKTILFVGRLVPFKRPDWLLSAFLEIKDEGVFDEWKLRIIGNGELKEKLQKVADDMVEILEFIAPAELVNSFATASALCLPSISEHWGVVVHEALCSGLPVITSDTTGAGDDIIIHGYNGYKFDTSSYISLKDSLRKFMQLDDTEKKQMQLAALEMSRRITVEQWCATLLSTLS